MTFALELVEQIHTSSIITRTWGTLINVHATVRTFESWWTDTFKSFRTTVVEGASEYIRNSGRQLQNQEKIQKSIIEISMVLLHCIFKLINSNKLTGELYNDEFERSKQVPLFRQGSVLHSSISI